MVSDGIAELRTEFAGKEYGAVLEVFKARIKQLNLELDSISSMLAKPLTDGGGA